MTTDVSKTLAERGARYGQFIDHATIAQGLQEVLHEAPNWYRLQPDVRQMMIVITDKLARILNGDPDYTDNYHDIAGYSMLVERRLLKEQEEKAGKLFEADNTSGLTHEQHIDRLHSLETELEINDYEDEYQLKREEELRNRA